MKLNRIVVLVVLQVPLVAALSSSCKLHHIQSNDNVTVNDGGTLDGGLPISGCSGTMNELFIDYGPFGFHPNGEQVVSAGDWSFTATVLKKVGGQPSGVRLQTWSPTDAAHNYANLNFSTDSLGMALAPGTYNMVEREEFTTPGHAGLDVDTTWGSCNKLSGEFTIQDIGFDGGTVDSFTASFAQTCDGYTDGLTGCIHYHQ